MNRENIDEYITELRNNGYEYSYIDGFGDGIDYLLDDFESRTCENCKWSPDEIDCMVDFMGEQPPKTFGCNKFERKQDED